MKVYCTPVQVSTSSTRYSLATFFNDNVTAKTTGMDYNDASKAVVFRFFSDKDVFACVILTIKNAKSYFSANMVNKDFSLTMQGIGKNKISEANILILNKKNMKGVYIHNEGSMLLQVFESKIRSHYYSNIRLLHGNKKKAEVFAISRIVDKVPLMDKIKKYSFVDEISATFISPSQNSRILNSSIYGQSKSVRVTMRTNGMSLKTQSSKDDLAQYLTDLQGNANNISFRGRASAASEGETMSLVDRACSVETLEHDDYLKSLNGMILGDFLKSTLFLDKKKLVTSHRILKN